MKSYPIGSLSYLKHLKLNKKMTSSTNKPQWKNMATVVAAREESIGKREGEEDTREGYERGREGRGEKKGRNKGDGKGRR